MNQGFLYIIKTRQSVAITWLLKLTQITIMVCNSTLYLLGSCKYGLTFLLVEFIIVKGVLLIDTFIAINTHCCHLSIFRLHIRLF